MIEAPIPRPPPPPSKPIGSDIQPHPHPIEPTPEETAGALEALKKARAELPDEVKAATARPEFARASAKVSG